MTEDAAMEQGVPPLVLQSPSIAHKVRDLSHSLGWIALAAFVVPGMAIMANGLLGFADKHAFDALFYLAQAHAGVALLLGLGLANRGGNTGVVEVGANGISVTTSDGAKHIHPHMIDSGVLVPSRNGTRVELRLTDHTTLVVRLDDHAQAEAFLSRIRASGHAAGMTIGLQTPLPVALGFAMAIGWLIQWTVVYSAPWLPAIPVALALAALLFIAPTHVVAGDDGLRVRRVFRERFIAYENIAKMEQDGVGRLRVSLDNGKVLTIGSPWAGKRYAIALQQRIEEAMNPETGSTAAALKVLSRGERDVGEWRAALRGLFSVQPGYRGPRLSVEDALAIVRDATRAEEHRVGAAVALGEAEHLDDGARDQLRVAAKASANPRLRVVLEGVADRALQEAELIEALDDASQPSSLATVTDRSRLT